MVRDMENRIVIGGDTRGFYKDNDPDRSVLN